MADLTSNVLILLSMYPPKTWTVFAINKKYPTIFNQTLIITTHKLVLGMD
jgi:hypothetical protein